MHAVWKWDLTILSFFSNERSHLAVSQQHKVFNKQMCFFTFFYEYLQRLSHLVYLKLQLIGFKSDSTIFKSFLAQCFCNTIEFFQLCCKRSFSCFKHHLSVFIRKSVVRKDNGTTKPTVDNFIISVYFKYSRITKTFFIGTERT